MLKRLIVAIALVCMSISIGITLSGCGKEEFRKTQFVSEGRAVGFRTLPPKVDIVLLVDNTPSVNAAFATLQTEFQDFIGRISSSTYYWDYHVGRISIAQPTDITQVLVNPEFNKTTLSDGTPMPSGSGIVPANRAVTAPQQFPILTNTVTTGNADRAYESLLSKLQRARTDTTTNFLRPDALLAIIVMTNGADSEVDPDQDGTVNYSSRLGYYANALRALKNNDDKLIRFYPIASYSWRTGASGNACLNAGGTAFHGGSYFSMLSMGLIRGLSSDFCSQSSLTSAMELIQNDLQAIQQAYIYSYIVLDEEPISSSIRYIKNGVEYPRNTTNGWNYLENGPQTVCTITGVKNSDGSVTRFAQALDCRTGYVIELYGDAELVGDETPQLIYEKR